MSRRGSSFYNFVSSMRPNDTFRLFSSGPAPAVTKTPSEALNTTEFNTEMAPDYDGEEINKRKDPIVSTTTKDLAKQRLVGFIFVASPLSAFTHIN